MDALPMTEDNEFGHKSTKPGLMHGCGHDGHTAILIGAAKYLAQTRNFDGTAVLIFQPAEGGKAAAARAMLEDGLFDTFPCDAIYALHNWPGLKPGINPGPMMAAADRFEIQITSWRTRRPSLSDHRSRHHRRADHHRLADDRVAQCESVGFGCRFHRFHAGRPSRRHERDSARGEAGWHGPHLPQISAGNGRDAHARIGDGDRGRLPAAPSSSTNVSIRRP